LPTGNVFGVGKRQEDEVMKPPKEVQRVLGLQRE